MSWSKDWRLKATPRSWTTRWKHCLDAIQTSTSGLLFFTLVDLHSKVWPHLVGAYIIIVFLQINLTRPVKLKIKVAFLLLRICTYIAFLDQEWQAQSFILILTIYSFSLNQSSESTRSRSSSCSKGISSLFSSTEAASALDLDSQNPTLIFILILRQNQPCWWQPGQAL